MSTEQRDRAKFVYHESARIIRHIQDRVCELAYTGDSITGDERETLADMLIELHQLVYSTTLYELHEVDDEFGDNAYSDGRPVVELCDETLEPTTIPAEAYRGDVGDYVAPGDVLRVYKPGEAPYVYTEAGRAYLAERAFPAWKLCAELRSQGQIEFLYGPDGHIVKDQDPNGRMAARWVATEVDEVKAYQLLGVAIRHGGAVREDDLAAELGWSVDETRKVLRYCESEGLMTNR